MARISGIDLPENKKVFIALRYIYGIGPRIADRIVSRLGISSDIRIKQLSEDEIVKIRDQIANHIIEGDLRRKINQDVKRLVEIGSYRGNRHRRKLPARGQRTHTNARTKRGKRVAVAGKKKVTK